MLKQSITFYLLSRFAGLFMCYKESVIYNLIIALANRIAEQGLKTGKCRTLEPMNPYERRIIHTAVQAIEGVTSASFGEGVNRRVVIGKEGTELKPLRNDRSRGRRDDRHRGGRRPSNKVEVAANREPKKDSDIPLYGKIN